MSHLLGPGRFWPSPRGRAGFGPARKKREGSVGPRPAQPKGPGPDQLFGPDRPTDLMNLINYYVLKNKKKFKKIQTNSKKHFKKFVIFLNIFLPSLLNIGLYTYMVRYKSGIKTPGFLRNTSKKKFKKRKKYFIAYGQVLKIFPSMFSFQNKKIASFSCFKNPKKWIS